MSTSAAFEPPLSDGQLVAACLAGDTTAIEALCRRYVPRMVLHLTRSVAVGRTHDAEDIAQEAMTKALGALNAFDQTAPLWPWLRKIAENTARDHYRLVRHQREISNDGLDLDGMTPPEPDHAEEHAERDKVLRAMQALPRQHRDVIEEVEFKQTPIRAAAAMFAVTYPAMRQRVVRARAEFRRSYETLAGLPVFQWFTKAATGKLAATGSGGGALAVGLSVAIPVLVITGLAIVPDPRGAPARTAAAPAVAPLAQTATTSAATNDAAADPAAAVTTPRSTAPTVADPLSSPGTEPSPPPGVASGVRAPEVTAPVAGVGNRNDFQDGPGFTTYSVPAADLDGSGPLEVSNDTDEADPVHAVACGPASATGLADCRRN